MEAKTYYGHCRAHDYSICLGTQPDDETAMEALRDTIVYNRVHGWPSDEQDFIDQVEDGTIYVSTNSVH